MKTSRSIVLCAMIILQTVKSQNLNHKIYLEAAFSGGIQRTSPVAGFGGALGFLFIKTAVLIYGYAKCIISTTWLSLAPSHLITVTILILVYMWEQDLPIITK